MSLLKKSWIEIDTYEKLEKESPKNKELMNAFFFWDECFYRPWLNAWKSGRTKLSYEEALREGVEPMETCTSFAKCGPRPDWRTPKQKAAEEAVLKSRKK